MLSERIKMNIKWTHRRYGKDYTVATLSKLYLTVTGIIMQSLKTILQVLSKWAIAKSNSWDWFLSIFLPTPSPYEHLKAWGEATSNYINILFE